MVQKSRKIDKKKITVKSLPSVYPPSVQFHNHGSSLNIPAKFLHAHMKKKEYKIFPIYNNIWYIKHFLHFAFMIFS